MKIISGIALYLFFVVVLIVVYSVNTHEKAFNFVCQQILSKYIEPSPELDEWGRRCFNKADSINLFESRKGLISRMERELGELLISHLHVYSPVEESEVWQGEVLHNGIFVYAINGQFIVSKVIKESPADLGGILPGDIVLAINGEIPISKWQVMRTAGEFSFSRAGESFSQSLGLKKVSIDESPRLSALSENTAVLKISSFRQEYFKKADWQNLSSQFKIYNHIIVDLRENKGGDFVAGLRALSAFQCESTHLGYIEKRPRAKMRETAFVDKMNDQVEFYLIENFDRIHLKTFRDYDCFKGKLTVLMDAETSSVSEIFADAMIQRKNTRVWGENTAGEVVLAVFYTIPELGRGYSLSIPEANYKNNKGEILEGGGVMPQKWLNYEYSEATKGQDSWLLRATEK